MNTQRGFTLIELLVVVAIIVAIAAAIIPLVLQFAGRGEDAAKATELDSVQTAIDAMMTVEFLFELTPGGSLTAPIVVDNSEADHLALTATAFAPGVTLLDFLRDPHTIYCYTWGAGGLIEQSPDPVDHVHPADPGDLTCPP